MNFNGQLNMFFGRIISYTCDLHLKLDILNPLNNLFCQMVKKWILWFVPFPSKFKTLKFLYDLVFHQVHLMNMYFHKRGHVFVVQLFWNQLYDLKKKSIETLDTISLKDQKWHLHSIQINLTRHHFIYWHTTIHYNFSNVK
jgi:hypothetical protein